MTGSCLAARQSRSRRGESPLCGRRLRRGRKAARLSKAEPILLEMKPMRSTLLRVGAIGGVVAALGILGSAWAGEYRDAVVKIAEAHAKGDKATTQKGADALAKKVEEIGEVMDEFKLRTKGGIGVGAAPGAVTPDG